LRVPEFNSQALGKRIAIISIAILFIFLAILGYYLQEGRKKLLTDPYKAISPRSCFVIETADLQSFFNSLTTGKGVFGEMASVKELQNFTLQVKVLADQLNKPGYKEILEGSTSLISFIPSSNGKLSPQLAVNVPGGIRLRHLKEILHTSGVKEISGIRNKGRSFLAIPYHISGSQDTLLITIDNGLLLCNTSFHTMDETIELISGGNDVRNVKGFTRVHTTSGKNIDKIFVIYPNLPDLIKNLLSPGFTEIADKLGILAATSGGDIYINENGLVLSGYTETTDSSEFLYRYKSIAPRELHTYKFLPAATVLFETMVQPDDYRTKGSEGKAAEKTFKVAENIKDYTNGEITKAIIDLKGQPIEDNNLMVYELSNRVSAEQAFLAALGKNPEVRYYEPDEQLRFPVYEAQLPGLAGLLKAGFNPGFSETWFTFYDNYLFSASSYSTLSRVLYDNILNKTLANDLSYKDFESTLPSRAGYYFYFIPSRLTGYIGAYLNDDIVSALKENKASLNKIQSAGFQFTASNGMIYNSMSIRFKEEAREESNTEWETLLDTLAAIKPFFFTNHNSGAKEIFIQDLNNNTYLINSAGRVLWKVPLNERITGNIYMIDYFRNGKYQILFSGRNYLHLLDRNGNYVERYPVKLRSPAANPLVVYDYDNSQNYRLFIAGEDKMIYSYDKTGSVVKGWKPFRTAGSVRTEINYFKVSGKDFIVASDENSIYFLDRSGKVRMTPKEPVVRAKGSAMRLTPGSEPAVVCTSPDGTVQHIFFDGTVKKFSVKPFSSEHSFDLFDVNGDGFGEYIFIDKGVLYLYGNNRTQIFARDFGSENLGGPINFIFSSSERKIGVFDPNKKLIYLIGKEGGTMEGFPLRGASMFSIGKLSDKSGWNLIVGGTDRFLYNYKIETDSK
jgi:hypothetical protein